MQHNSPTKSPDRRVPGLSLPEKENTDWAGARRETNYERLITNPLGGL